MKTFKVILTDGEKLTFTGARLNRDGMGVTIYDADDNAVALFTHADVKSAFEVQTASN